MPASSPPFPPPPPVNAAYHFRVKSSQRLNISSGWKTIQTFAKKKAANKQYVGYYIVNKKNRINIDIYSFLIGSGVTSGTGRELGNFCSAE